MRKCAGTGPATQLNLFFASQGKHRLGSAGDHAAQLTATWLTYTSYLWDTTLEGNGIWRDRVVSFCFLLLLLPPWLRQFFQSFRSFQSFPPDEQPILLRARGRPRSVAAR